MFSTQSLPRTSPGNACADEAAGYPEINKAPQAGHAFDSSSSSFGCFATVSELRMSRASLDRFRAPGAVEAADGHPKRTRVEAAT
jgi:hypothetical protein